MKIILLGSQGVGKGTYARLLTEVYKIPSISTGELLRQEIKNKTEIGKKAKGYMDKGNLVPDEIVLRIFKQRIKQDDCKKGFMLDGFPRNIAQAKALEKITKIDKVLYFVAPDKIIIERLSGRRICGKCGRIYHIKNIIPKKKGICDVCGSKLIQRHDETPEGIKIRLKNYREKTMPLIAYYKKKGILHEIDASKNIKVGKDEIINACRKALD